MPIQAVEPWSPKTRLLESGVRTITEVLHGGVAPRWKIPTGPASTLKKPRGVVLDPKNKELIVADMRLNAILTYYFPEIF